MKPGDGQRGWSGKVPAEVLPIEPPVLITGGAGFIGSNLADRLLSKGSRVIVYDNLSRRGAEKNLRWLLERHGEDRLETELADIRDIASLRTAAGRAGTVFHLAAQVAVTTSVADPVRDFEINLQGTLNLLEILRCLDAPPPLVFTSTNKVYGGLEDLRLKRNGTRYEPAGPLFPEYEGDGRLPFFPGISEDRPMKFQSPYGCSKGAADQYVLDYAKIYGIRAVVFRMSCIYGPRQFGTEDQGWVAHFLIRALRGEQLTIYGDGMQVRDILFIDDLLDAFQIAAYNMEKISGEAFNIGGGPDNSISLLELIDMVRTVHGSVPQVTLRDWRPGDQKFYVTDYSRFGNFTGWRPKTGPRKGVLKLYEWLCANYPVQVIYSDSRVMQ